MARMDERTKELIAVGAAVTANCLPCLEYHVGKAREVGAAGDEIREAIEMGRTVRKGAAAKLDRLSATLADPAAARTPTEPLAGPRTVTEPAAAPTATEGCGCT